MRISCISLTDVGSKALIKCINDNHIEMQKYTFAQRKEFTNIWKEIITYTPLCKYNLLLKARSGLGASYYITKRFSKSVNSAKDFNNDLQDRFNSMVVEIDTSMQKEGVIKDIDYTIEVLQ